MFYKENILVNIEVGKYYWLRNYYNGEFTIGKFEDYYSKYGNLEPYFMIIGDDSFCFLNEFEVICEIEKPE